MFKPDCVFVEVSKLFILTRALVQLKIELNMAKFIN